MTPAVERRSQKCRAVSPGKPTPTTSPDAENVGAVVCVSQSRCMVVHSAARTALFAAICSPAATPITMPTSVCRSRTDGRHPRQTAGSRSESVPVLMSLTMTVASTASDASSVQAGMVGNGDSRHLNECSDEPPPCTLAVMSVRTAPLDSRTPVLVGAGSFNHTKLDDARPGDVDVHSDPLLRRCWACGVPADSVRVVPVELAIRHLVVAQQLSPRETALTTGGTSPQALNETALAIQRGDLISPSSRRAWAQLARP